MIEPLRWQHLFRGKFPSPFMNGAADRPLKITFHRSTLTDPSPEEAAALEVLKGLARNPNLEAFDTDPGGPFPHIEIGERSSSISSPIHDTPVTLRKADGGEILETGIWSGGFLRDLAAEFAEDSAETACEHLLVARAHHEVDGDVLVTLSDVLLNHRTEPYIAETNPRTPVEAAQIAGLLLRSRDDYTYHQSERFTARSNRWTFYAVLARSLLSALWKCSVVCSHASQVRRDLAESVIARCARALEARDAIGEQFYSEASFESIDRTQYHLDYLTLLVTGAMDAQLRLACRAYGMDPSDERYVGYRSKGLKKAQKFLRSSGGTGVDAWLSSSRVRALVTLAYEPRNTIHGVRLIPIELLSPGTKQFLIQIPAEFEGMLEAAEQLGSKRDWGLAETSSGRWAMEPFSFATTLVRHTFDALNQLASETDVERLLPAGQQVDVGEPPETSVWNHRARDIICLLG